MDVCREGNAVVSLDRDLLSLKSDVLDLVGFSIADLRSHEVQLLISSSSRLLRQVYRTTAYFGPADPPMVRLD